MDPFLGRYGPTSGCARNRVNSTSDPHKAPGFERAYDPGWLPALQEVARGCAPALADVLPDGAVEGWAGLHEQTPDANALIGEAAGEVVADLVTGRAFFVDVAPLRAERFAEHAPVLEANTVWLPGAGRDIHELRHPHELGTPGDDAGHRGLNG